MPSPGSVGDERLTAGYADKILKWLVSRVVNVAHQENRCPFYFSPVPHQLDPLSHQVISPLSLLRAAISKRSLKRNIT